LKIPVAKALSLKREDLKILVAKALSLLGERVG
jgi:hypothetical protein